MITHNGIKYNWEQVYKICGLCKQDFDYDPTGSVAYFQECLTKWDDGK